jgi:hypothetical protein
MVFLLLALALFVGGAMLTYKTAQWYQTPVSIVTPLHEAQALMERRADAVRGSTALAVEPAGVPTTPASMEP